MDVRATQRVASMQFAWHSFVSFAVVYMKRIQTIHTIPMPRLFRSQSFSLSLLVLFSFRCLFTLPFFAYKNGNEIDALLMLFAYNQPIQLESMCACFNNLSIYHEQQINSWTDKKIHQVGALK